jgi:hypothetical protein
MLEALIIILLILWVLGSFGRGRGWRGRRLGRWGGGNLFHVLLIIVIILLLIRFLR